MLRFFINNLKLSTCPVMQYRYVSDKSEIIIAGGLEKHQGGLKEENYFYKKNCDLIAKISEEGTKLKYEDCVSDWSHFEKILNASDERTALRETCSLNKHKNCLEEAFFLNEQNECCSKLCKEGIKCELAKENNDQNE